MKPTDFSGGIARLRDAAETLQRSWQETRGYWNDANARHIEEERLRPLLIEVKNAMTAIQRFAEVVRRAEIECVREEDRPHDD